ncbi:MAG: FCD domain-containing protein [Acetobacteraceae bacterium]
MVAVSLLTSANPSRKTLEPLSRITQEMTSSLGRGDLDTWGEADEQFHRELVRLSGNHRLYAICSQMRDVAKRGHVIAVRMQSIEYKKGSMDNHRKLIGVILRHNPDDAAREHALQRRRGEEALIGIIEQYNLKTL